MGNEGPTAKSVSSHDDAQRRGDQRGSSSGDGGRGVGARGIKGALSARADRKREKKTCAEEHVIPDGYHPYEEVRVTVESAWKMSIKVHFFAFMLTICLALPLILALGSHDGSLWAGVINLLYRIDSKSFRQDVGGVGWVIAALVVALTALSQSRRMRSPNSPRGRRAWLADVVDDAQRGLVVFAVVLIFSALFGVAVIVFLASLVHSWFRSCVVGGDAFVGLVLSAASIGISLCPSLVKPGVNATYRNYADNLGPVALFCVGDFLPPSETIPRGCPGGVLQGGMSLSS